MCMVAGCALGTHMLLDVFKKSTWFKVNKNLGLGQEDCQHAVIDEFLCMVAGCALGTDEMC